MTDQEINLAVARKLGHFVRVGMAEASDLTEIPDYCHDIAAAWECLKDCEWKIERLLILSSGTGSEWLYRCTFVTLKNEIFVAEADAAPVAICKAFLELGFR